MAVFERWLDRICRLLLWAGCIVGALMMLQITASAAGRAFFNSPIDGSTEIASAYYMVAMTYLPLAWVTSRDEHIVVDLFTAGLGSRNKARLDVLVTLITLLYLGLFTWQTTIAAMQQMQSGEAWESGAGFLTVWPSRWQLPLAGLIASSYLALRFARGVLRVASRTD